MRIIESRSIDNQAGLLGSRLITGTNAIEGAFQSFIVAEDTVVTKVYNSIGIDVTGRLGLTSITLKAGAFISMPKGDYFSSIKLASGSIVAYFTSHGGMSISADAYLSEFLSRTGSSYLEASECVKAHLQQLINIGLLQKASLIMSPSMYEEDLVKSVVPQDASGDLSFTRASDGTRINSAGLVEVCPWNLALYSEDFSNGVWTTTSTTITADNTTAPNGTATADKVEISSSSNARVQQIINSNLITGGLPCTFSVYIKSVSGTGNVGIRSGQTGLSSVFSYTNQWQRFEWTFNAYALSEIMQFCNNTLVGGADSAPSFYAWGAQLNIGSTAKPYFPTTDRLNVPRLTYQNGGGGCPSLLLEKQSTNLFPNSQTTANWSFSNMSRTANYGISPDGTQNADLLFPTTSGSVTFQSDITTSSLVIGQPFVVSFFIKLNASFTSDAGTNILDIRLSGPTVWSRPTIRVNLETGAVTATNNASYISSTNFGNGWFRITFGATPTGTSGQVALQLPTTVTMNGGSFYIWGLQGEANATYATSYIPTTSSSATRVADACFKTGISSLIGQTSGSVFFDFTVDTISGQTNSPVLWYMKDGGTGERYIELYANGNLEYFEYDGSAILARIITTGLTVGRHKCAIAYALNDFVFYVDGVQIGTDTSGTPNGFSTFALQYYNSNYNGQQKVNQCAIFKTRLTNAELASLTTI